MALLAALAVVGALIVVFAGPVHADDEQIPEGDCTTYYQHSGYVPGSYDFGVFYESTDEVPGDYEVVEVHYTGGSAINIAPPPNEGLWDRVDKCHTPETTTTESTTTTTEATTTTESTTTTTEATTTTTEATTTTSEETTTSSTEGTTTTTERTTTTQPEETTTTTAVPFDSVAGTSITAPPEVEETTVDTLPFTGIESGTFGLLGLALVGGGALVLTAARSARRDSE